MTPYTYHEYLQARSENRKGSYRRYRKQQRFKLVTQLDDQQTGTVKSVEKPVLHFIKGTVIVKLLWDHDVLKDVVKGVK